MQQQLASDNFRGSRAMMEAERASQAVVADDVVLDGRLAVYHKRQHWLAVADLHFGYELSQRAAGRLMPMWGMQSVEARLLELLRDYAPRQLVILGDIVHDRASAAEARLLLDRLRGTCEVIALAGNHDRRLGSILGTQDSWRSDGFHFHHGHCAADAPGRTQIIGHHHPSGTVKDGAGLRLKLPAFVQQGSCWIMPAFSPWAAGAGWQGDAESRIWLCSPQRILQMFGPAAVSQRCPAPERRSPSPRTCNAGSGSL